MLDYPKTLQAARLVVYGCWAGNERGHKYVEGQCVHDVWKSMTAYQCQRKNGYGAEGLYCKVHAQKLGMIESPPPKPRRKSYLDTLIDRINALEKENEELRAKLNRKEQSKMKMKQECNQDHRWNWDDGEHWVCANCGKVAASDNAHIEPCLSCGNEADADATYCEECE